ncbi:MAG: hypothetical protein JW973_03165 [Bacteroidales bacterium]|nr:hypothetical protein [Bacteroidales bacterium]
MKKALLSLVLISFYVLVYGQPANDQERIVHVKILTTDTLIKGIYVDLNDFQQNYPSIRTDFRSNEEYLPVNSIYNDMDINRLLILNSNNTYVPFRQKHWGICDGEHVFINFGGKYQQISMDGKYSSFTASIRANMGRSLYHKEYFLNVVNGDRIIANYFSVSSILSKENETLYNEFKKDKNKYYMMYTYIIKLNQSYEYK